MSRLTEDQIKAGILHADIDVRFAALHYFADCSSPNTTVMPVVIEALERFGRAKTFRFSHPIARLAQTEPTICWAVEELKTQPRRTEDERSYLDHLSRLLCHADPRLLQNFEKEILAAPAFDRKQREDLARRLKLLSWDGDALWRELETICEEGKDKTYAGDMRLHEAEDIVEELGRQGARHVDRMMHFLKQKIEEYENNPLTWMEPLVVKLAGELRYTPAIPLIVAKLHEDAEVLSEECQTALVKTGGDDVIRAVRQDYPTAEGHFRLYGSGVLGRVHTDLAVQALIELLSLEQDLELENWLAQALVEHFSTEGNEAARKVLLSDPDLGHLRDELVSACTLMGQDFPELEEWCKEAQEEKRSKPFIYGGTGSSPPKVKTPPLPKPPLPKPPLPKILPLIQRDEKKKVGRNDPCPCGSGKKHKHCCINKSRII
jgi:hypothetical protein